VIRANLKKILWSVSDVAFYPVIYTLTIPVFINAMGERTFGIWMLINAVMVAFQLFNFGLGTGTLRNVSRFLGNGNNKEISRTINTNLIITAIIGLACVGIAGILVFGMTHYDWLNVDADIKPLLSRCILLAMPLLALKFVEQIFQYTLKAYERFDWASLVSMISRFGILGINLFLALHKSSLITMLFCNIIYLILIVGVLLFLVKKLNKHLEFDLRYDKKRIKEEVDYSKWTWIQSIFVILTYQGDRFLVMSNFGPSKLAYYTIIATMFNHIHMCFAALYPWLFPKVSKMMQQGEDTKNEYLKTRSFVIIFSVISLSVFYTVNRFLLTLWLGADKYEQVESFVSLFTIFELFFVFTIVPYAYCNSAGYEKLYTKITIVFTVLNFAGMVIGCRILNSAEGLIWGLIATSIPGMMWQNYLLNKKILHRNVLTETFFILVPSLLIASAILYQNAVYQAGATVLALAGLYRFHYMSIKK
jgi:O-antigen/teichoic acid export membrane protein